MTQRHIGGRLHWNTRLQTTGLNICLFILLIYAVTQVQSIYHQPRFTVPLQQQLLVRDVDAYDWLPDQQSLLYVNNCKIYHYDLITHTSELWATLLPLYPADHLYLANACQGTIQQTSIIISADNTVTVAGAVTPPDERTREEIFSGTPVPTTTTVYWFVEQDGTVHTIDQQIWKEKTDDSWHNTNTRISQEVKPAAYTEHTLFMSRRSYKDYHVSTWEVQNSDLKIEQWLATTCSLGSGCQNHTTVQWGNYQLQRDYESAIGYELPASNTVIVDDRVLLLLDGSLYSITKPTTRVKE